VNANVLTMERDAPTASAVAIAGDRILAVGDEAACRAFAGPGTRIADLRGKTVVPGFIDAHTHLVTYGVLALRLNLSNVTAKSELLEAVAARAGLTPEDGWVVGYGWDESKWRDARAMPTRAEIEQAAKARAAVLARVDMHMGVATQAALARAGLDPARFPDGHVREDDFYRVWDAVAPAPATRVKGVDAIVRQAQALGVTSAQCIVDAADFAALQEARAAGRLGLRVWCLFREPSVEPLEALALRAGFGDAFLRVGGVKLFADGSIGSRTAALRGQYAGGGQGQLLFDRERLADLARRVSAAGLQLAIHAIGDAAIAQCLDVYAKLPEGEPRARRHRIEHLELFDDGQARAMAKLGIVASVQPNFIGEWGHPGMMYEARLGEAAVGAHNRLRVLLDQDVAVAFGSDHMPFGPLAGIHAAANAPTPAQRLTVDEALRAYTIGAAYAEHAEQEKGSVSAGKLADLVVLDRDPREDATRVKDARVAATILGGRVVHGAL